jgi:hypothetical protein
VHFVVEAKSGGYPRDVRAAAWELERVDLGDGSQSVVSLVLDLPWAHYLVDRPVPKGARRRIRAVFRGAAASVAPP